MLTVTRQQKILDYLSVHNAARLTELADSVGAGLSTVRRDLRELEGQGLLTRVHGGALLANGKGAFAQPPVFTESVEPPIFLRTTKHAAEKQRIGEAAAQLVQDNSTIFITAGTTTEAMLSHLGSRQGLTVLTNSVIVAYSLSRYPQIATVVLGGWLRHSELSLLGHLAMQALRELRAEQIFHGTYSIDAQRGLAGSLVQEVDTDRAIIEAARDLIVLADFSKFNVPGPVQLAPVSRIHTLITDGQAPAAAVAEIESQGVQVIQV
jgi:DeoR/GlpR family transcriptional regulator of sugar metabolism